jgi:putative two-component system response regulator
VDHHHPGLASSPSTNGTAPAPPQRLLLVDDDPIALTVLQRLLGAAGYHDVKATSDPREAIGLFAELDPDLVFVDFHMPGINGIDVLSTLRGLTGPEDYLPIVMLTADSSSEAKHEALLAGATDFLTKPFDTAELTLRVRNLLESRSLHRLLEERVAERTQDLEAARAELLHSLALVAEFRDDETGQHTQRVGHTAAVLAEHLGMGAHDVSVITQAAPLHDLGKIGVSDAVLRKDARLTVDEFAHIQRHSLIGARILSASRSEVLRVGQDIACSHHERWDGNGYPDGISGEQIPLTARIVAVADVFDALTHARPYKPAWTFDRSCEEIERQAGAQFDPVVVDAFLRSVDDGELAASSPAA